MVNVPATATLASSRIKLLAPISQAGTAGRRDSRATPSPREGELDCEQALIYIRMYIVMGSRRQRMYPLVTRKYRPSDVQ
jgi:hypothetical protein